MQSTSRQEVKEYSMLSGVRAFQAITRDVILHTHIHKFQTAFSAQSLQV